MTGDRTPLPSGLSPALAALHIRVLNAIATGAALPDTLDILLRGIASFLPFHRAALNLLADDGLHLGQVHAPSLPPAYATAMTGRRITPPHNGTCGQAAYEGVTVTVPDLCSDTVFTQSWCELLRSFGLRSACSTPLIASDETVFGTFALFGLHHPTPQPADPAAIDAITRLATLAIERSRKDTSLARAEAQLRVVLETIPAAVWFTNDRQARHLVANPHAARLLRMTREDNASLTADPAQRPTHFRPFRNGREIPPESLPLQRAAAGADVPLEEVAIKFTDGTTTTLVVSAAPLRDASGRQTGAVCTAIDITDQCRAQDQARHSQDQFRALAENLPNPCWIAGADGYVHWYNRRWHEYCGTTPAEMEGWGWQSVHDPDVLPEVMALWTASLAQAAPFEMTFPLRGADGVFRPFLTRIVPIQDTNGAVLSWFGTNTDISAQRRTEAELRASEARLLDLTADLERQVTERARDRGRTWKVSPDLLSVITPDGRFASLNPAWQATLGWPTAHLQGARWSDFVHPDDLPKSHAGFAALLRGDPILRFENRYRCRDGSWRFLSWVAVPEDGRFYCSARDMTEARRQADELAARTAERDRLWRNSQDMLMVIDKAGIFQAISPGVTGILGWTPEEMQQHGLLEFVLPEDHELMLAGLATAWAGEHPVVENRCRHKDGGYRWLSWLGSPEGDLIFATARHITEQKAQQAALAQAEESVRLLQRIEALGKLAGGIAHDFNNVLQAVASGLDLIRKRADDPDAVRRYVRMAADAAARGSSVTGRLLTFARRGDLRADTVPVLPLLHDLTEMICPALGRNIDVALDAPPDLPPMRADKAQLETVLINLAVNAGDAMPAGGTLTVRARAAFAGPDLAPPQAGLAPGHYLRLDIIDTGTGMDAATLARAAEPFFTTKPAGRGTGLGLAMARGFAEQSGGTLAIQSAPGAGTTVTLFLPQTQADQPDSPQAGANDRRADPTLNATLGNANLGNGRTGLAQSPAALTPAVPPARRVLLADDNGLVREALARQLTESFGHAVIEASDGLAALDRLENDDRIELLVSDIGMPGMDGMTLAREARRRWPTLPIILLTGYAENAIRFDIEALRDPCTVLLRKPVGGEVLGQTIAGM